MRATAFFSIAVFVILAGSELAQAQGYSWTTSATLVAGSQNDCGDQAVPREIVVKDGVFKASSGEGAWTLPLTKLNNDGSGRIVGKRKDNGSEVYFDFEAGAGPRVITVTTPQGCRVVWTPSLAGPPRAHAELLRQAINARTSDDPARDLYTSRMKAIIEANRAEGQNFFTRFGSIKSIDFTGLEGRTEIYKVEFAYAIVRIRMSLDNGGKIAGFEYRKY